MIIVKDIFNHNIYVQILRNILLVLFKDKVCGYGLNLKLSTVFTENV
jgi:hypothetical protein